MKKTVMGFAVSAVGLAAMSLSASAQTVSGDFTGDNQVAVYLSTSDATLGTLLAQDLDATNGWASVESFSTALTSGNYYLHFVVQNIALPSGQATWQNPTGLIADLTLTGGYTFGATGLATLDSGSNAAWTVSSVLPGAGIGSWVTPTGAAQVVAADGAGLWNTNFAAINNTASWIGSTGGSIGVSPSNGSYPLTLADGGSATTYYSVMLTAAPIPEPETYAMMLAGLGMLGYIARRRKAQ